jgi:hypothetical protein
MRKAELTFPDLSLIAGTRAMLGAGVDLFIFDRLSKEQLKAVGWTLALVGAVTTTIPLSINVFAKRQSE